MKKLLALASFIGLLPQSRADYSFARDAIAAVLMAEARGEGVTGMTAVAEVIRNRGGDPLMQILRPRQFSCLNDIKIETLIRMMRRQRGWHNATTIASALLWNPQTLGNQVLGAKHYDSVNRCPAWASRMRVAATVGNHRFYIAAR